jgi:MHS family proline/betaine transporter-like MFS transporter
VLAWGWRIPFLIGAAVALVGLWLRTLVLPPSSADQAGARAASGPAELLRSLWPQRGVFLRVVAIIAFPTVAFYLVLVGLMQVAISRSPQFAGALSSGTAINEAVALAVVLLGGWLSDRYGARRCLRFGTLALAAVVAPAFLLMQQPAHLAVTLGQLLVLLPQRLIFGAYAAILPLQFPAAVRCTGYSLAQGLVAACLSGTAPLLASWMVLHQGWSWGPSLLCLALFPGCFWALGSLRDQRPSAS